MNGVSSGLKPCKKLCTSFRVSQTRVLSLGLFPNVYLQNCFNIGGDCDKFTYESNFTDPLTNEQRCTLVHSGAVVVEVALLVIVAASLVTLSV